MFLEDTGWLLVGGGEGRFGCLGAAGVGYVW